MTPPTLHPVAPGERILSLDVLRGFALFGILLVNIFDYAPEAEGRLDKSLEWTIEVLGSGSFYPLFSLLFGAGFAIFLDRAAQRGRVGLTAYLRRTVALLFIGIAQIVLLEDRSILIRYAFMALPLMLFWRASAKVCLTAAIIVFAFACIRVPVHRAIVAYEMRDPLGAAQVAERRTAAQADLRARQAESKRAMESGSFASMAKFRAMRSVPAIVSSSFDVRRNPTLLHILAMFLFGVAAWRGGLFTAPERHRRLLILCLAVGGAAGITGNLVMARLGPASAPGVPPDVSRVTLDFVSNTLVSFSVGAALVLLCWHRVFERQLVKLALVGRMGLTNYLWQSVVLSLVFLPYGAGVGSSWPYWAYPLCAILIYASHFAISSWWLHRYSVGPTEAGWKWATYGGRYRTASSAQRMPPAVAD